jgi:hypothetical protein
MPAPYYRMPSLAKVPLMTEEATIEEATIEGAA